MNYLRYLLCLLVVVFLGVLFYVNTNDFRLRVKSRIEQEIQEKTGVKVAIGDVLFHFPNVAILNDVTADANT
ncbi:MAG: hypothetical protein ACXU9U_04605, partial [Parachlamydiaceae bacterium]